MTTYYFFDTSALVKRYHVEAGSDKVDEVFDDEEGVFLISELTIVELASALQRKQNRGEVTATDVDNALALFAASVLRDLIVVGFSSGFIQQARTLVLEHNLRTLDALQLTAVLEFESLAPVFVCADDRLADAAEAIGFTVLNPQLSF
ncbi:MAG: type II toxin-antitoxin system VapC family toxin [Chloroflexota bacterium]|nr:type II toxin-antitoxin system VapC family toxin [Chloroflexota bacterium]